MRRIDVPVAYNFTPDGRWVTQVVGGLGWSFVSGQLSEDLEDGGPSTSLDSEITLGVGFRFGH